MSTTKRVRSEEEIARENQIRQQFADKPTREQLLASGDYEGPVSHGAVLALLELLGQLKEIRDAQGMTLDAIGEKTGMDRTALSRLLNARQLNPTIDTLARIGKAVGKRLVIRYEDGEA